MKSKDWWNFIDEWVDLIYVERDSYVERNCCSVADIYKSPFLIA